MAAPDADVSRLLPLAERLADAARAASLPIFRTARAAADNKSAAGFDPVTEADRAAERAMRDILARERPLDGVDGEEFGVSPGASGLLWRLDPIDGTRAFLAGLPVWTVLIGLEVEGRAALGVIDQPFTGERYAGCAGAATLAHCGRVEPLRVGACARLRDAVLATTDPFLFSPPERGAFEQVRATCRLTRYGLDAYAYARLAAGTIDVVVESGLQPHDVCALIPVIESAGGVVTDWRGAPADGGGVKGGQIVAAANRGILEEALVALRRSAN
jgi:histidinol phosphatase-like enzyme (inositol monophosphatase family)